MYKSSLIRIYSELNKNTNSSINKSKHFNFDDKVFIQIESQNFGQYT